MLSALSVMYDTVKCKDIASLELSISCKWYLREKRYLYSTCDKCHQNVINDLVSLNILGAATVDCTLSTINCIAFWHWGSETEIIECIHTMSLN